MTSTTLLHADVQRMRFTQHALAAVFSLLPDAIRPAFAAPRDAADEASIEAQRVRSLAATYAKTDPGFASDLYAAAARHEGLRAE